MKNEALKRMELLGLYHKAIQELKDEDKLNMSINGFLFWLSEYYKKRVREFEEKTGCYVYHVIQTQTAIGLMLSLMYVSPYPDEWPDDIEDLKQLCPIAYVINLDDEYCSEFGSIGIRNRFGGLIRTA